MMPRIAPILLWVQMVLSAAFVVSVSMLGREGGLQVIGLYFYYLPLAGLIALAGVWLAWRYPGYRRHGIAIALAPIVAALLPFPLNAVLGGPLLKQHLLTVAALLFIAWFIVSLVAPRRVVALIPDALFRSRLWNSLVILGIVAGWLLLAVVVAWVMHDSSYRRDTGTGIAYAIILASLYVAAMGLASAAVTAWAWLGLRGGVAGACRRLNIAQLVVAIPGVLIGGVVFLWLGSQG